jgi:phosphatidylserine/phosphatidylglycerophosphate/cardiolipin synthase-like enzyme
MAIKMESVRFFTRDEYYQELAKRAGAARKGQVVVVATMSFKPELPGLQPVLDGLMQAAGNGAKVRLIVDAYNFLINNARPGPLFFKATLPERLPKVYQYRLTALEQLKVAAGSYSIINWPARALTNPFAGRSHLKFAIIGQRLYIGGCNLNPRDHIDVMVGWQDQRTSDWLSGIAEAINKAGNVKRALQGQDTSFTIDSQNTLLVDAGVKKQSLIFDQAMRLIDEAEERIFMTCQYFPNSTTARHLAAAVKRGVDVQLIYGHHGQHPFPLNIAHHLVELWERLRNPAVLFRYGLPKDSKSLHAKVLVSEKAAMVGSHNYVTAGVRFGTAEIALHNTESKFGAILTQTILNQLQNA